MMKGNLNMNNNIIMNTGNLFNSKDVVNLETLNLRTLYIELKYGGDLKKC